MAIESVTGISNAREQYPELVIPVTNPAKSGGQKKQVEQNRRDPLQRSAASEEPSEEKKGLPGDLEGQVKQANQLAESLDRSIHFFVHEASGRTAVNVVDKSTHQIIKTVPPEQLLDLVAKVTRIAGIFFDEFI